LNTHVERTLNVEQEIYGLQTTGKKRMWIFAWKIEKAVDIELAIRHIG